MEAASGVAQDEVKVRAVALWLGCILTGVDTETDALAEAWRRTQAALPSGWTLEGLRCASDGLAPDQRSDDWIALAIGPGGVERQARAADPITALDALAVSET